MGADIYLSSVHDKNKEKYQPLIDTAFAERDKREYKSDEWKKYDEEGWELYAKMEDGCYFRDSYNSSSLFWLFGLSWWAFEGYDDENNMKIEAAKELRKTLVDGDIVALVRAKRDREKFYPGDTEEDVVKYFTEKRDDLVALLDKSIELNEPLYCSV